MNIHNNLEWDVKSPKSNKNISQKVGQELVWTLSDVIEDKVDYTSLKPSDLWSWYKFFKLNDWLEKEDESGKYIEIEWQKYRERDGESEVPGKLIYHDFGNSNFEIWLMWEDGWHLKKWLIKYSWTQAVEYAAGEFNSFWLNWEWVKVWRNWSVEKGRFRNGELSKKMRDPQK